MNELALINEKLYDTAEGLGMCDKFAVPWENSVYGKQELIDMYFRGLDFCIEHHYPTNEMIKKFFESELRWKNGVFVDESRSVLNATRVVALGRSTIKLRVNGFAVSQMYLRDNSTADVFVRHHAHLIINLYDNASVKIIEASSTNTPVVILHGNNVKYELKDGLTAKIKKRE